MPLQRYDLMDGQIGFLKKRISVKFEIQIYQSVYQKTEQTKLFAFNVYASSNEKKVTPRLYKKNLDLEVTI